MGPTACGKSELGIRLCEAFSCELVSVDSVMVYRGLDIGTAKPSRALRRRVPHHLVDIRDPWEGYSAADFCADARAQITAIHARGRTPLLAGGTMLYFHSLLFGLSELPPADAQLRALIDREAEQHGWEFLHRELQRVDPESAARIHPRHNRRLQRALEVYRLTGVPPSALRNRRRDGLQDGGFRLWQCALLPPPTSQYRTRLARRFLSMLEQGLEEEVRALAALRAPAPVHSVRAAVGYRQVWDWLEQGGSREEMVRRAVGATHTLARRQMNWLRRWEGLHTFAPEAQDAVPRELQAFLAG